MCWPFHHHWKIISQSITEVYEDANDHLPIYRRRAYVLQCLKCGWLRHRIFKMR